VFLLNIINLSLLSLLFGKTLNLTLQTSYKYNKCINSTMVLILITFETNNTANWVEERSHKVNRAWLRNWKHDLIEARLIPMRPKVK